MSAKKAPSGQQRGHSAARSFVWTVSLLAILVGVLTVPSILTAWFDISLIVALQRTVLIAGVAYLGWLLALFR